MNLPIIIIVGWDNLQGAWHNTRWTTSKRDPRCGQQTSWQDQSLIFYICPSQLQRLKLEIVQA